MSNEAAALAGHWIGAKLLAEELTGVCKDALHVLIGLVALLVVALILRRSLASFIPAFVVLLFELANEVVDLTMEEWPDRAMWPGSVKDVLLTMAGPLLLLLAVRWFPNLFLRGGAPPGCPAAEDVP